MLLKTTLRSGFVIFFMIICVRNTGLAFVLDGRKCLVFEDYVTDAPKVEVAEVRTVLFNKHLSDSIKVKYAKHIRLICDINLSVPHIITWYGRSKNFTKLNGVSEDGKVMDIESVGMEYHGEYITCQARILSNSTIWRIPGAHLLISDLARPELNTLKNKVTMMENTNTTLSCNFETTQMLFIMSIVRDRDQRQIEEYSVSHLNCLKNTGIVAGVPPPIMSWQVKRTGDNKFSNLSATGAVLTIENISLTNNGQYRCIAKNVKGENSKTIDVVVQKLPEAFIEEESEKTFNYGDTTEFTCRIKGNPLPKTVWKDSLGHKLDFKDIPINWHEKISKLKLNGLKKSNNYSCYAESELGNVVSSVEVPTLSPFVVHMHPKEKTNVHYEASTNIVCNITASFPMKIKWFRQKTVNSSEFSEIHSDKQFKITSDETVLHIVSMDLVMVGNYTCEASLVSDENEKIAFTTDVQIDNLAPPLTSDTARVIVMEDNWITLSCKIIGGVPRPTMSWQVMRHGDTTYKDLSSSSEDLDVKSITIADAGKYRCVAKNAIGEWSKVTDVLVRKSPVTTIEEGSAVSVAYGSNNTFTCRVVAYPLPSITWEDSVGHELLTENTTINEHVKTGKITVSVIRADNTYHCLANNTLGQNVSSINVTVLSPFVVHQYPERTTNVHYAASTSLVCNITSSFPLEIKWYHNSTEIHSSANHTISDNKTVLHINSMDMDLIGIYRCEATLLSDESQKKALTTNVRIDDLRFPEINYYNGPDVTVHNLDELTLVCNVSGNPVPVVTWQVKLSGSSSFKTVGGGESLSSNNFGSSQAGLYKCIVSNVAGEISQQINVIVTP